jgi:hypothetical protein
MVGRGVPACPQCYAQRCRLHEQGVPDMRTLWISLSAVGGPAYGTALPGRRPVSDRNRPVRTRMPGVACGEQRRTVWQPGLIFTGQSRRADWVYFFYADFSASRPEMNLCRTLDISVW